MSFCVSNGIHKFLTTTRFDPYPIILLVKWKMINLFSITQRDVTFHDWVRSYLRILVEMNTQFFCSVSSFVRKLR